MRFSLPGLALALLTAFAAHSAGLQAHDQKLQTHDPEALLAGPRQAVQQAKLLRRLSTHACAESCSG